MGGLVDLSSPSSSPTKELVMAVMQDSRYMETRKEKPLLSMEDKDKDTATQGQKSLVGLSADPEKQNKMIGAVTGAGLTVWVTQWKTIWPYPLPDRK